MGGGSGSKALAGGGGFANTFGACFVAGTLVFTQKGLLPIEKIKSGDLIWSKNIYTGEKTLKKVLNTYKNSNSTLVNICFNDIIITTTFEHTFWSNDKGWIPAKQIKAVAMLKSNTGQLFSVEKVERQYLLEPVDVYNIEVEDWHCYFVSKAGILVHNNSSQGPIGKGRSKTKDAHLFGKPGKVNRTGYKETLIGHDGRAKVERHHTDHYNSKNHSSPHDHIITWDKNGNPAFKQINYPYGKVPPLGRKKSSNRKKQTTNAKKSNKPKK